MAEQAGRRKTSARLRDRQEKDDMVSRRTTSTSASGRRRNANASPATKVERRRSIVVAEPVVVDLWLSIGTSQGLSTDYEIASFLLTLYKDHNGGTGSQPSEVDQLCSHCTDPLTLYCIRCQLSPRQQAPQPLSAASPNKRHRACVENNVPGSDRSVGETKENGLHSVKDISLLLLSPELGEKVASDLHKPENHGRLPNGISKSEHNVDLECGDADVDSFKSGEDDGDDSDEACSDNGDCDDVEEEKVSLLVDKTQGSRADAETPVKEKNDAETSEDSGTVLCPYCKTPFTDGQECRAHAQQNHKDRYDRDGQFTCIACRKLYPSFKAMWRHMRLSSSQQNCAQCGFSFDSRCQTPKHKQDHEKSKARFCADCDQSFVSMSKKRFLRHVSSHHKSKKEKALPLCPQCGKVLRTNHELKRHLMSHSKERPFTCPFPGCGGTYKDKKGLKDHSMLHEEKRHQCEFCGSKFNTKGKMDNHMHRHWGKSFTCAECQRRYATFSCLKDHVLAVHRGVKRHSCSHCGLQFFAKSSLNLHLRSHTGEKPFQCEQCSATFSTKYSLQKHGIRHTGRKPYGCEDCGLKYSCVTSFRQHRKKYHSDSLCKCHRCGEEFASKVSLSFHARMYHLTPGDQGSEGEAGPTGGGGVNGSGGAGDCASLRTEEMGHLTQAAMSVT